MRLPFPGEIPDEHAREAKLAEQQAEQARAELDLRKAEVQLKQEDAKLHPRKAEFNEIMAMCKSKNNMVRAMGEERMAAFRQPN
jgi:hypothetical protein